MEGKRVCPVTGFAQQDKEDRYNEAQWAKAPHSRQGGCKMFESLDDKIRESEHTSEAPVRRWLRYAGVFLVSMMVFSALYAGILFLE